MIKDILGDLVPQPQEDEPENLGCGCYCYTRDAYSGSLTIAQNS